MDLASMFGIKAPAVASRIKAEPGFHVLLAPTTDASMGCLWVEVEEWGLCSGMSINLGSVFGGDETVTLTPFAGGGPIVSEGRIVVGRPFAPGVTAEEAIAQLTKSGTINVSTVKP